MQPFGAGDGGMVKHVYLSTRDRPRKGPERRLATCPWLCWGEAQVVRNE